MTAPKVRWFFMAHDLRTGNSKEFGPYDTLPKAQRDRTTIGSAWRDRYDSDFPYERPGTADDIPHTIELLREKTQS